MFAWFAVFKGFSGSRYSDFIIFGSLLAYYAQKGNFSNTILLLFIVCGTFLVSYIRARAELLIPKCDVGIMERAERIILLAAGSITGFIVIALWVLALGTHITAFHRIYYTYKKSKSNQQQPIQKNLKI